MGNEEIKLNWIIKALIFLFAGIVMAFFFSYYTYLSDQSNTIEMMLENSLVQTSKSISGELEMVYTTANNTYLNASVQQSLQQDSGYQSTVYDRHCTAQNIESLSQGNPVISCIALYPLNGTVYEVGDGFVNYKTAGELRNQPWLIKISKTRSGFVLLPSSSGFIRTGEEKYLTIGRTIYASYGREIIGYQFVVLNRNLIQALTKNNDDTIKYYLSDSTDRILFVSDSQCENIKRDIASSKNISNKIQINNDLYLIGTFNRWLISKKAMEPLWGLLVCIILLMCIYILLKLRSLKRAMNLENSMNPGKDIA